MPVQLLVGLFKNHLNEAGNDFESMPVGDIAQLSGSNNNGDCEIIDDQGNFFDHTQRN